MEERSASEGHGRRCRVQGRGKQPMNVQQWILEDMRTRRVGGRDRTDERSASEGYGRMCCVQWRGRQPMRAHSSACPRTCDRWWSVWGVRRDDVHDAHNTIWAENRMRKGMWGAQGGSQATWRAESGLSWRKGGVWTACDACICCCNV